MAVLANLVVVVAFAFLARAMLAARGVSWSRSLLASGIGLLVGLALGGLLVLGPDLSPEQLAAPGFELPGEVFLAAVPFQLMVTMGLLVMFELISSRPAKRRRLRRLRPIQALRRRVAIAGRGIQVSRVAAREGLGGRGRGNESAAAQGRALRRSIEDLGGVYVKLGQLLATRPDLLPPETVEELSRLHSSATPLPIEKVQAVLTAELGDPERVFSRLDAHPLGSASIAQAHSAVLRDGSEAVVKVQRPGLEDDVERDLAILDWVADVAEHRIPAAGTYGVAKLADEFTEALRGELDFGHEAAQVAAIAESLAPYERIRVPHVFEEFTTPRVLVMERLRGRPLSEVSDSPLPDGRALADELCASQIQAMMRGRVFHGDPHPGNVLVLDDGRLGLIDFGLTGKLDSFGRSFVLELLAGVRLQDPALMYEALVTGGAVDLADNREQVERALAAFMTAHLGPSMISPAAMTDLLRVTAELGVALPDQAAVMLRAIGTLVGTLEMLSPGYPFVDAIADAAGLEVREKMTPSSVEELLQREATTLVPFARRLPRHIDRIATQIERGQLTTRVSLFSTPDDVRVLERLVDKTLLVVLGIGIVALSIMLIGTETGPTLANPDLYLTQLIGWITLFFGAVLVLRALLDVLRHDPSTLRRRRG